ncbi:MAG: hypothetical protein Q8K36_02245, partial [Alphaproteobacteria bacterium]|nr:hypothetical protein [Alphaproteobacteria bacterium]
MIADAWKDLDFKELSPLCVDLDGTLITTDVLYVSWWKLAQRNMFQALWIVLSMCKGRAYFKKQLAEASPIDPSTLTYHTELLAFLKAYKQQHAGLLVLATATNKSFAQAVDDYLGIFDQVIAS